MRTCVELEQTVFMIYMNWTVTLSPLGAVIPPNFCSKSITNHDSRCNMSGTQTPESGLEMLPPSERQCELMIDDKHRF